VIPLDEARQHVLERCPPLPPREVEVTEATGCVLAVDVVAAEDVPPFANSAMDGYAVQAADVAQATPDSPALLRVVGEVAAGAASDVTVAPGEALKIMTGAPMPAGADAVVMVEATAADGDGVQVKAAVGPGDAVRLAGSDIPQGATVFTAGTAITPAVAAVLASVNVRRPVVYPKPKVAVLSTGDELVDDGGPLGPGQIRESNKVMLVALVAEAGFTPVDYGIVRDDEAELAGVLRRAADECDAIVTSGGVSMGDYDVVKAVLSEIADMRWMQIAIRPAKPLAFGLLAVGDRQVPVFGLPGNPVSSLVSFELFARPGLRRMAGHPEPWAREPVPAIADVGMRRRADGKVHLVRVRAAFGPDGRLHAEAADAQGSHQLAATAHCNALAVLADGEGVPSGGEVPVVLL
jgi:molybdopterin molybdotransferase